MTDRADAPWPGSKANALLTLTETGMLLYWLLAALMATGLLSLPPQWMYPDHTQPVMVAWNWSFFPIDALFALLGLSARFAVKDAARQQVLTVCALSLMFCAGVMALSFWIIQGSFDPLWWGMNLWLVILPVGVLARRLWQAPQPLSV